MENFLCKILDKISRYEIITNLIPGTLLVFLIEKIGFQLDLDNLFLNVVLCYFIGLINNRFSSLCIEEPLKGMGFIKWREYEKYNIAKKERPFIAVLQETANQFRALTATFLIALLAVFYQWMVENWSFMTDYGFLVIVFLLFVLFLFSFRKQINDYVVKNIDEVNNANIQQTNTNNEMNEKDKDAYIEEHKRLEAIASKSEDALEERTYQIAAGGLSVTFAVFSYLSAKNVAFDWQLILIWSLYVFILLLNYFSHRISIHNARKMQELLKSNREKDVPYDEDDLINTYDKQEILMKWINFVVGITLIATVVYSIIYASIKILSI